MVLIVGIFIHLSFSTCVRWVAVEPLKGESKLRCAVSVKCILNFEDLVGKKKSKLYYYF